MPLPSTIFLGSDHGGLDLKSTLHSYLTNTRPTIHCVDLGTDQPTSVDYPDFAQKVAQSVLKTSESLGILICGTGIGISIAANRFNGIRAALVYDAFTAKMAKAHNNANILCLGGRTTDAETAKTLVDIWIDESFEGDRHMRRLAKLDSIRHTD